ncbi:MAG: hypothetical protein N3G21_09130 [Candidatus Hydrogenedentes bacterium]|nr:hypothetical protein [Candidatus Hydrogenedentota bacterium]
MILCPHCNQQKIGSGRLPPDVVMILPCPSCHEYSVVFRNKAIPVNRKIIERGTRKEKIEHLANIIEMFLELALPKQNGETHSENIEENLDTLNEFDSRETEQKKRLLGGGLHSVKGNLPEFQVPNNPITEEEVRQFIENDLKCLDDPEFFKKHFGRID